MVFFLGLLVEERCRHAEIGRKACQHRDDRCFEPDLAGSDLMATPFWLSRCEQLRDARRALSVADAFGRRRGLRAEGVEVAEMRNIDRNEEMRAVIWHAEVAVERPHRSAERALRQQSAQQVDQEGEAEALG